MGGREPSNGEETMEAWASQGDGGFRNEHIGRAK